jgi:hypothetical protein
VHLNKWVIYIKKIKINGLLILVVFFFLINGLLLLARTELAGQMEWDQPLYFFYGGTNIQFFFFFLQANFFFFFRVGGDLPPSLNTCDLFIFK